MGKIKMVLFDLDGTLLPMDMEEFTGGYFKLLASKAAPHGYDLQSLVKAIWHGVMAMVKNNGSCKNEDAFWDDFASIYGEDKAVEDRPLFDEFYRNKTLKKSIIFKRFYAELVSRYGKDKAKAIWDYAEKEFEKLQDTEPSADKTSVSYVFPAVALYRSVEHFYPEEALAVTRSFGTTMGLRLMNIFKSITALPGIPLLMWKNMDKEYMNGFRGANYRRTTSVAEGDDCCDYRLKKSF